MAITLICPGDRPAVGFLSQTVPLVAVPLLGESLLSYWMDHLAQSGAKAVRVLATDRPEIVRALVGNGSRWGLDIDVQPALKELTLEEAAPAASVDSAGQSSHALILDHLPGAPAESLFRSYRDWFKGVLGWMPDATRPDRIGLREIRSGVWCGNKVHITPTAMLRPPCWLGDHVQIGAHAVIGPDAVLENRVVVDRNSEVFSSIIGPDTFVGRLVKVEGSLAWGSTLIDWRNGSCTQVPDSFLLSSLGQRYLPQPSANGPSPWHRLCHFLRASAAGLWSRQNKQPQG
jgi:NDP-sugar pyrophosphorylase family protein